MKASPRGLRESGLRAELAALDDKREELERVRRGRELMAYHRRIALESQRVRS